MYLLDTDTCSAHLKRNSVVQAKFLQHVGTLYLSTISLGELQVWVRRAQAPARRRQSLEQLLKDVLVLDVTENIARRFGEVRARQLDVGRPSPILDLFVARTALEHGLTVVTHNTRHYADVPGISLEDWLTP